MPRRAVGVVVGVVDRHLQGERDDQREQRRHRAGSRRARRRRRCRRARAPRRRAACAAGRRRPTGRGWPSDLRDQPPRDGAAVGLAGVQGRDRVDQVQLARGGRRAQPLGRPRRAARAGRGGAPAPGRRRRRPAAPTRRRAGRTRPRRRPPGASRSAASTAGGATLTPPVMTTSSSRPVTVSRPSASDAGVAGAEPAVDERLGGRLRVEPVAQRQHRAGQLHAAVVDPHAGRRPGARRRTRSRRRSRSSRRWSRRATPASRARVEQRRVGGRAADEDGVERAQRVGLGVEVRGAAGSGTSDVYRRPAGMRATAAASGSPRASTVTGRPASTLRQSTCRPAIAETGRASSQLPGPPSRSWVAVAEAVQRARRTAARRGRRRSSPR